MLAVLLRVTETPEAPLDPVAGRRAGRVRRRAPPAPDSATRSATPESPAAPSRSQTTRAAHRQPSAEPETRNIPSPWPSPARIGTTTTRQVWPLRRQARDRRSGAASTHRAPCCRCSHCVPTESTVASVSDCSGLSSAYSPRSPRAPQRVPQMRCPRRRGSITRTVRRSSNGRPKRISEFETGRFVRQCSVLLVGRFWHVVQDPPPRDLRIGDRERDGCGRHPPGGHRRRPAETG